jgi:type II secretory pathway component GspD/PulD (secretin)
VKATLRRTSVALATVLILGCVSTGSLLKSGDSAAARGDWDAAVAYYREALTKSPKDIKAKLNLERAVREASLQHVSRARALEAQEQWAGAAAEYKLAAELLPSNALAVAKTAELERKLRAQVEALRPPTRMEQAQRQAAQLPGAPRLDPRTPLVMIRFTNTAIRDILNSFRDQTGINWTPDEGLQGRLSTGYTIDLQDAPFEEALNKVLSANRLVYKVTDSKTIFIYEDTPPKRQQWDDRYQKVFYLSNVEASDVMQMINGLMGQGGTTGPAVRPVIQNNKTANALIVWATLPVLESIANIVSMMDKPRAEVLVDVQIMEVSRQRLRDLGIELSAYSLGFALVPDVPAGGTPTLPPPPVSIGRLRQGVGANDVFTTLPSALVKFLETDGSTRLLARPQLRGREGSQLTLQLGDDIPYAQTAFLPIAGGGVPTQPQVSYTFRPVGVNLTMTPKVTYNDEIILDPIQVDKSALAESIDVGGGVFAPSFSKRTATVSMRLRDGESNLLAGLIAEQDRKNFKGFPGLTQIPILRSIIGSEQSTLEQSELVMIVTPYIIRSREITADDLRARYVGAGSNIGGSAPSLISPDAPPPAATVGQGGPPVPLAGGAPPSAAGTGAAIAPPPTPPGPVTAPPPAANTAAPPAAGTSTAGPPPVTATAANAPRPPGIVNIPAVGGAAGTPPPQAPPAQLLVNAPAGEFQMGGAPYSVPISITNVSQLGTVTVTVTYDPAVLKADVVMPGSFMQQGGVTPTFTPKIDAAAGRVDIVVTRGVDQPGANGSGPLAGIMFRGVGAGTSRITIVGVATTPTGQAIVMQAGPPASVVVK